MKGAQKGRVSKVTSKCVKCYVQDILADNDREPPDMEPLAQFLSRGHRIHWPVDVSHLGLRRQNVLSHISTCTFTKP